MNRVIFSFAEICVKCKKKIVRLVDFIMLLTILTVVAFYFLDK